MFAALGCDSGETTAGPGTCVPPESDELRVDEFFAATPEEVADALGRGVNLGNMFDAPEEGAWTVRYDPTYPALVRSAGFSHVRLPVRWSNHAGLDAEAELDPAFACRIDAVIQSALDQELSVVMDVHHYRQLDGDKPDAGERVVDASVVEERLVNIWRKLSRRYRKLSNRLVFELYNEPHAALDVRRWNGLFPRLLAAVREASPERAVMLGGSEWASAHALTTLDWPDDANLLATFHDYDPIEFTFQGSTFPDSAAWVGTTCCDERQQTAIRSGFDTAQSFGEEHGVPVYLGEWGSSLSAPKASRASYARFVRDEAESRGFPWAVWGLVDFGIYDPSSAAFIPELLDALVGP
jgi:endoglucanase